MVKLPHLSPLPPGRPQKFLFSVSTTSIPFHDTTSGISKILDTLLNISIAPAILIPFPV